MVDRFVHDERRRGQSVHMRTEVATRRTSYAKRTGREQGAECRQPGSAASGRGRSTGPQSSSFASAILLICPVWCTMRARRTGTQRVELVAARLRVARPAFGSCSSRNKSLGKCPSREISEGWAQACCWALVGTQQALTYTGLTSHAHTENAYLSSTLPT